MADGWNHKRFTAAAATAGLDNAGSYVRHKRTQRNGGSWGYMSRNVGLPSFHPSESLRSYLMAARSAGIELV